MRKVVLSGDDRISETQIIRLLEESVRQDKLDELLSRMAPQHQGYRLLRRELKRYRDIDRRGGWRPINHNLQLSAGDRHEDIPYLRWLLNQYGDLPSGTLHWFLGSEEGIPAPSRDPKADLTQPEYLLDGPLRSAIAQFQKRHKLEQTGALNKATIDKLNVPPYQTAQRIALNMKRWRQLPSDLGERHIMVNMADYSMQLVENGQSELEMKVIIGRLDRRTPVMSDLMRIIEVAPTWTVPHRIAGSYILPNVQRDPDYLKQKGFDVLQWRGGAQVHVATDDIDWSNYSARNLPYTFVQRPGKLNALGTVKFLFPNDQSIYLHDTSTPELFDKEQRALSSGCVRVEKPRLLAEKLLQSQDGWHRGRLDEAIEHNHTSRIRIKNPVPVHLMYWTTWVDDEGQLQIRNDIYQRDLIGGAAIHASL